MSRVKPLRKEDVPDLLPFLEPVEQRMGFIPNSMLTMARRPALMKAFAALGQAVNAPDNKTSPALRQLVAHAASHAAGCRYCEAHTASNAARLGIPADKIAALWSYETSPLFSDAERAALGFAQAAASVPNMVDESDFARLRQHFDDDEIVEIMAVVAYFGFLNRWNDSMGTPLEDHPVGIAAETLAPLGWSAGKHAAE